MKKIVSSVSVLALLLMCLLVGCGQTEPAKTEPLNAEEGLPGVWADATYTADTTLGEGSTTLSVVVSAEGKSITFTINTNQKTVGAALLENNLIEGDQGDYGLYVKKVNGMLADYDVDQTYWAFYENDAYASAGVDTTNITAGVTYKLERTAG